MIDFRVSEPSDARPSSLEDFTLGRLLSCKSRREIKPNRMEAVTSHVENTSAEVQAFVARAASARVF